MADEQQDTAPQAEQEIVTEDGDSAVSASEVTQSAEYQELNNRYLRLAADFENFRKRQAQEREFLFKYGAQTTLESMLPVLDNLERAQQSLNESSDPKMLYKSFEMLSQQMRDALKNVGMTKMNPQGEIFDPERHEAVTQVEKDDVPDHSISEVYQDGYMLHDRVLRPAKVVVAVNPNDSADGADKPSAFGQAANNPFQKASTGQE